VRVAAPRCLVTKTLNRHQSWALVKSTERLKTGAEKSSGVFIPSARRVLRPTGVFAPSASSPAGLFVPPGQGHTPGSGGIHRVRVAYIKSRGANSAKGEQHPSRTIGGPPPNDSKTGGKRWTSCDPGPVGGLDRPSVGAGLGRWPVVESLRQNRPHLGIG
jgi:hypothetical protein